MKTKQKPTVYANLKVRKATRDRLKELAKKDGRTIVNFLDILANSWTVEE